MLGYHNVSSSVCGGVKLHLSVTLRTKVKEPTVSSARVGSLLLGDKFRQRWQKQCRENYASLLALRRLRTLAAIPARPVPSSSMAAGSGIGVSVIRPPSPEDVPGSTRLCALVPLPLNVPIVLNVTTSALADMPAKATMRANAAIMSEDLTNFVILNHRQFD